MISKSFIYKLNQITWELLQVWRLAFYSLLDWSVKLVKEMNCYYYFLQSVTSYTVFIIWFFKLNLPCQWRATSRLSLNCWNLHRLTLLLSEWKRYGSFFFISSCFIHYSLTFLHLFAVCKQPFSCYLCKEGELCLSNPVIDFSVNLCNSI